MNSGANVLITGCGIYLPGEGKAVWGDLWECGEAFIINACLNDDGDSAWCYNMPDNAYSELGCRCLIAHHNAIYFERRGIIVIAKTDAELNVAARLYLARQS